MVGDKTAHFSQPPKQGQILKLDLDPALAAVLEAEQ